MSPNTLAGMNRRRDAQRERDLARMKFIAFVLLAAAAALYAVATAFRERHPAWGYAAAFAEAAMVGAVADWFAIVALFRHPLGLPIPHTAIIARSKTRIGGNLARFIVTHFLDTPLVLAKLRDLQPGRRVAHWLARRRNARTLAQHAVAVFRYALVTLDDERVRAFVRNALVSRLEAVDVTRLGGQLLDVLTSQGRHQVLLDEVLQQLARLLQDERLRERFAALVAAELRVLRYVGLDTVAGAIATEKIAAGVGRLIAEMADDPQHELRQRFDTFMADFVRRLKEDPEFRLRGEDIKREVLAHPALAHYLQSLWSELLAWLGADLARPDSSIRQRVEDAAFAIGRKLLKDPAMQAWIDAQLIENAPRWIERYRDDVGRYIEARVAGWDTRELVQELESNIGRDLQFIRINGTLVGGLVGLAIHCLTQWAQA